MSAIEDSGRTIQVNTAKHADDTRVTTDYRSEAIEVLRRFVHREVGSDALQTVVRRLEISRLEEICDSLALDADDFRQIGFRPRHLVAPLRSYLEGAANGKEIARWVTQLLSIFSSRHYEDSGVSYPAMGRTLGLILLLIAADCSCRQLASRTDDSAARTRRCLELALKALLRGRPLPARSILRHFFRAQGTVHLSTLEPPIPLPAARPQWLDLGMRCCPGEAVALDSPEAGADFDAARVRLIPLSVFTRGFFRDVIPELLAGTESAAESGAAAREDRFHYHPENDKMIALRERHPALRVEAERVQYFVDSSGLAEVVIDRPALGKRELLLAAKIFCLFNGVRSGTLDGGSIPLPSKK
jgi:hypothetical protein